MAKKSIFFFFGLLSFSIQVVAQSELKTLKDGWLERAVHTSLFQLKSAAHTYQPGQFPRSVNPNGLVHLVGVSDWTSGFFPGSLWYGYELTGDDQLAKEAKRFTLALDSARLIRNTHDLGFMINCSYGNAFRITGDSVYLPVLKDGAKNLFARFSPVTGVIRSWDFGKWQYPVIIDNMMNLEYLYWASGQFNQPAYARAANAHAITTLKNHFRKDYSSYHVVDYDPATGKVLGKATHQGLSDKSAWARGQGWALYGYAMCYAATKNQMFLKQAVKIARFIMDHPRMPKDKIPAWDFDVHNSIEGAPRDASAAAVIASGLLELSTHAQEGILYFKYAEAIFKSLSSDVYLAKPGENHLFILKHSVGAFLFHSEIDTPLNYADYYYLEALKRYIVVRKRYD